MKAYICPASLWILDSYIEHQRHFPQVTGAGYLSSLPRTSAKNQWDLKRYIKKYYEYHKQIISKCELALEQKLMAMKAPLDGLLPQLQPLPVKLVIP